MFGSYVTIAFRQLVRRKLYSAVNILGFAIGLACVILIGLFVHHELGYDDHYRDADRIYRISADYAAQDGGQPLHPAANVQPAGPQLREDFAAEVEQAARIWGSRVRIARDTEVVYEDDFRWADASLFEIFDFSWIRGDPQTALAAPATVVLTQSTAEKYFGTEDPIGQSLLLENQWPLTVTGVIRDLPPNTHLSASAIASFDSGLQFLGWDYANNWSFWNFHTYVRLRPGVDIQSLIDQLPSFVARHKRPGDMITGMTATALDDIHLKAARLAEMKAPGSWQTIATFAAIATCILLIAFANFANLSTARAAARAREVGMRKVFGATRSQVMRQFLGEAMLVTAIAMVVAIAFVELVLPAFGAHLGRTLTFDYLADWRVVVVLAGFTMLAGLAAGSYPAFYLSAFEPRRVLSGDVTRSRRGARFRSALVVLQFAVAIALCIITAVLFFQTKFATQLDRGFETANIVVLAASPTDGLGARWKTVERRLLAHPEITHVSAGSMRPGDGGNRRIRVENGDPRGRLMPAKGVDYSFFDTYGIELVAGRTFSAERGTDAFVIPTQTALRTSGAYVLNELAVRELGWTAGEALGKWLEVDFSFDFTRAVRGPIIGVVANTYVDSVRAPLRPFVYFASAETWAWGTIPSFSDASVRVTGDDLAATLNFIDTTWRELIPEQPVSRYFLDDTFRRLEADAERQSRIFAIFSGLAIVVACLGLIGLASYATQQRTREIGVRKALGGSVADIVRLLTHEFSLLVVLANIVAWPVAYVFASDWLAAFSYRIDLSPLFFLGSASGAFALAWLTVGAFAVKAACATPIESLRHE